MKLFSTLAITALTVTAAMSGAAEVIDMTSKDFWEPVQNVEFSEGQMVSSNRIFYKSKKPIAIDPTKKYTITAHVSSAGNKKSAMVFIGLSPATANGKTILAANFQGIANTLTEIAADVKKGDTTIKIKDGSKWKTGSVYAIALDAKADFSDIPNKTIINYNPITSVKKEGDVWVVTFKNPIRRTIAAGTVVRQHMNGGYFYFCSRPFADGASALLKRTVTGVAPYGVYQAPKGFPPNMQYAHVVFLVDWYRTGAAITIKDAKLIIE